MIHLLVFRDKAAREEKILAATANPEEARATVAALNNYLGYQPGYDIHAQDVPGNYSWQTVPLVEPGELEGRFQDWLKVARRCP